MYAPQPNSNMPERRLDELLDSVLLACGQDHVSGLFLLQHQPDALDVVSRVAPVPRHVNSRESQGFVGRGENVGGDAPGDAHGDEAASWMTLARLVLFSAGSPRETRVSGPRLADSWLKRMPLTAHSPFESR